MRRYPPGLPESDDLTEAFAEFVRGRSAHLFQLALLLTDRNQADAQDLVQLALERAWVKRRAISRSGGPEPYVRRVLVNASIDRRRRLRRRAERPLDDTADSVADPADSADPAGLVSRRDLLIRSLAALPPRQRAVLVLRYWEDLPEAEVATTLGCSVGTVKSQASRGLARLRELAGDRDAAESALARRKEEPESHD